ncbi:protein serine/threonine phosphatase [Thalassoporum mexicanum PCC 7367]|uniref:PP2C family protein-serine/threonine phosphatase n=1 Tax=Thalassoporum mexicanum TaxID=3457544 RepID=UPI00029F8BB4|nr:protein phosphatase 2C domain-containing protein [Pseudanabaena sp. PCC 7367]AFY70129.1 protein serine/threonine phosphatase [Pseudanabaena sp. PCC 7367]
MKLSFAGDTDKGCVRAANQDSYYIDPEGRFFIVADGMGGHAGGEEASRIATDTIKAYLESSWNNGYTPEQLLREAVFKANQEILLDQTQNPMRGDMGTTVVVVAIDEKEQPWFCHIGDSRLYRLRGSKLDQISDDHTWIARAIQTGSVAIEEARTHPWRHMLLQCLGREDINLFQVQPVELQPGDRLLICSDGLTEELSDDRIAYRLKTIRSAQQAAASLIDEAKSRGGRDNITVVIIHSEMGED